MKFLKITVSKLFENDHHEILGYTCIFFALLIKDKMKICDVNMLKVEQVNV